MVNFLKRTANASFVPTLFDRSFYVGQRLPRSSRLQLRCRVDQTRSRPLRTKRTPRPKKDNAFDALNQAFDQHARAMLWLGVGYLTLSRT
jgi:hypothetical protein